MFDTWFDSSISPLYILKWSRDNRFFDKAKPCTLRPQGKEIIRTWLYYTLLKDYLLIEESIFKDVWVNHHVLDEKGRKMSKSAGNIIDPHIILAKYGAESLRLWTAVEGNIANDDIFCSYDRIEGASKTLTKLWNVARFISMFPAAEGGKKLLETDKWLLNELAHVIHLAQEGYPLYDFHTPTVALKHFLWETFASHYLELVKSRAYNEQKIFTKEEQNGALATLSYCLETLLQLLAPVVPMITYHIYKAIWSQDVHALSFPRKIEEHRIAFSTADLISLNSAIWKMKKDKQLSLKAELAHVTLPEHFKGITPDLRATHNIKQLSFSKDVVIQV